MNNANNDIKELVSIRTRVREIRNRHAISPDIYHQANKAIRELNDLEKNIRIQQEIISKRT